MRTKLSKTSTLFSMAGLMTCGFILISQSAFSMENDGVCACKCTDGSSTGSIGCRAEAGRCPSEAATVCNSTCLRVSGVSGVCTYTPKTNK